jgi:CubicO group peptidase (beta-lactamase class C family)
VFKLRRLASFWALLVAAGVALVASDAGSVRAQQPPPLPDDVVRIAEALRGVEPQGEVFDVAPPCCVVDGGAPAVAIPRVRARIDALIAGATGLKRRQLEAAAEELDRAWSELNAGSDSRRDPGDLDYLNDTMGGLRRAALALEVASAAGRGGDPALRELQAAISDVAGRMAGDVFGIARGAGVPSQRLRPAEQLLAQAQRAHDAGRYVIAVSLFDTAIGLAGNTIDFDIDAFEQNILDALEDETIGYTYAITLFDDVYASDGIGEARIAPDLMPEAQDPGKEMSLASVSKTLTAVLILRLLEENGLTPDDPIGPWLPEDWERGAGVDAQTFRDFLTHETGFTQKGVDPDAPNTYAHLQAAVAIDVPGNTTHSYNNANFGIFRVVLPALGGFDLQDYPEYEEDELSAAFFVGAALNFYEAVDVHATCNQSQPNPTIYYSYPHNNFNGLQTAADYSLECGGYGFYMSSDELGVVLADLAADDELLADAAFDAMREGFLGFFDPANGYFWGNGGLGIYHNHGGDWEAGIKGLDACVMLFPNGVTATLQINSIGGDYPYQCEVLRAAFDAAWVPG